MEVPQKMRNVTTTLPSNFAAGYISKGICILGKHLPFHINAILFKVFKKLKCFKGSSPGIQGRSMQWIYTKEHCLDTEMNESQSFATTGAELRDNYMKA